MDGEGTVCLLEGILYVALSNKDLRKCNVSKKQDTGARIYGQLYCYATYVTMYMFIFRNTRYEHSDLASQCIHRYENVRYKIYAEGQTCRRLMPIKQYCPIKDNDKCRSIKHVVDWGILMNKRGGEAAPEDGGTVWIVVFVEGTPMKVVFVGFADEAPVLSWWRIRIGSKSIKKDETLISPANVKFAGSFVNVPHRSHDKGEKKCKTRLKLAITELLKDLDAENDENVLVTFVPKNDSGAFKIGGVKIVLDN
ncbi:hypothetical protein T459_05545 [Capsicum annuum]|uniref:Polyphenol oxidase C-terminal domain-containing protein n=1 Tax=Capsicum annuum TaxID=4072 RepID=A0A2G3A864_CAPAN|nr:hypothetical protein T459_05545 [Capsicum annuum]